MLPPNQHASALALPPSIKPRVLKRRRNPASGWDYVTSDGRYEITPQYAGTPNGGNTPRICRWAVKDLRAKDPNHDTAYLPSLNRIRESYCAPTQWVPWLVCDMDEGVMRVAASRKNAVSWAKAFTCGQVLGRSHFPGSDCYDYQFGVKGEESGNTFFVMPADAAHRHGFDPVQQPRCPYPDAPYERVRRPGETMTTGTSDTPHRAGTARVAGCAPRRRQHPPLGRGGLVFVLVACPVWWASGS